MGLLAEFAYITLESDYYRNNKDNRRNDQIIYSNTTVENYLKATEKDIEDLLDDKALIKKEEERDFWDYFKINYDTVEEYKGTSKERAAKMLALFNEYDVVDFTSDNGWFESDFQGMLLRHTSSQEYVIAFRGTAGVKDVLIDSQLAVLSSNHNYQLDEAVEFVEKMKKKYGLSAANLTLTGHSLGGILSQAIGVQLKIPAFAFNPLGTSKLEIAGSSFPYNSLAAVLLRYSIDIPHDEEWIRDNIITISYNDTGILSGDILSNFVTKLNGTKHLGTKIDIFGKRAGVVEGHSIVTLNKVLEKEAQQKLTTIEDIRTYNQTQKTLFLKLESDIMMVQRVDNKETVAIQSPQMITPLLSPSTQDLFQALNHENIDIFTINAKVGRIENKEDFDKKLYYSYKKNKLKLKTESFKEASTIIGLISRENQNLKKHDIIIQLQED